MDITKICSRCKIEKPLFLFNDNNKGCVDCLKNANSINRKNYDPVKTRRYLLKKRYNITPEDYDLMFKKQKGLCLICSTQTKLYIDHCHTSKKVRGLICNDCNIMLGQAKDNITTLKNAIKYLKKSE